ncbi:MAG: helix-turn-helix domain-containing protein, partial [Rubrivivax sp.]|nr:helix-turn-helix domain-containing protein [Rubrivivax sp.]
MKPTQAAKPQNETAPVADEHTLVGRLLLAYGVKTFPELAERMELGLSTVKNWHYRDSVRLEHLVRASADTSRSLDWLATGAESLFGASASRKMN